MSKCRYCPKILKWKQPYKKGDFPVEENGKKHNCPNRQSGGDRYASKYGFDMWTKPDPPRKQYQYCGKCIKLCKEIVNIKSTKYDELEKTVIGYWCEMCKMYPNITYNGTEEGVKFEQNPDVKPLMITNAVEIKEKYSVINNEAPTNWIHLLEDGTMKAGYKLTQELTKWYEGEGKESIKNMHAEIWFKKKELD